MWKSRPRSLKERERAASLRTFFARYVAAVGAARDPRIEEAFAAVRREPFAGPGPWSIRAPGGPYVPTPSDDVAFIYQDTLLALDAERGINIGQPGAHARWLDALALREGETVVQIGTGTGYYTALLAYLVGPKGRVHAYEIDEGLAARAMRNLADMPWATVHARSGVAAALPETDAVYVNAAATQPSPGWLEALRPGGRLMFPLHAQGRLGGMLRIDKPRRGLVWAARFVSRAAFIACVGGQDAKAGRRLSAAFKKGGAGAVRSFRRDPVIEETCWLAGDGWWLSTAPPPRRGRGVPKRS